MDANLNKSSLDVPTNVLPRSKPSVASSSLASSNIVSAKAQGSRQSVVPGGNVLKKHIIRKIIPIDPKKLQQAGLDRKIAEALSKQKSQQSNSVNQSQIQTAQAKNSTVSKPIQITPPSQVINKLKPPIITVTGPEALSEQEKQNLANLNPQQRLVHVKNLLNKKILQKKSKEINDNKKTNQLLQTPQAIGDKMQQNLPTKYIHNEKYASKNVLKEPVSDQAQAKLPIKTAKEVIKIIHSAAEQSIQSSTLPIRTKATQMIIPQKSRQDIVRKLFFQAAKTSKTPRVVKENITNATQPIDQEFPNCLKKDKDIIPKASITSVNIQQYKKPKTYIKKSQQVGAELSAKKAVAKAKKTESPPQTYQTAYIKQQNIPKIPEVPKAAINTVNTPLEINKTQNLDFPEVSPLKTPFPTVNVPKETPLPDIDSFKKHRPLTNTIYWNFQQNPNQLNDYSAQTNYEGSLLNQQPTTSNDAFNNANKTASATNCLVVLENKILSQDEMIDLTELRLSTNTPRFIYPHRPIPEVIIKQEHPDEYQAIDVSLTSGGFARTTLKQQQHSHENEEQIIATLPNTNKQQKKIIINAQKLQLPPEKLADLAKKIKESSTKTKAKKERNSVVNKYQDINMFDAKVSNTRSPLKGSSYIFPPQTEIIQPTSNVMPQTVILPHTQIYDNTMYSHQDHNYYDGHSYFLPNYSNNEIINSTSLIDSTMTTSSAAQPLIYTNYYENSQDTSAKFEITEMSVEDEEFSKSAVEIIDEPVDTEDCFSAVDFIAALGGANGELSPEELNLSASCASNQNYSPVEKTVSPQKPSPLTHPKTPPKASEILRKSTIVIESSKGQETILTKESPDKNDLEKVKEKIKIYHEMNKQKLASCASKQKSPNKFQQIKYKDNAQMDCLPLGDTKLHDNTNLCEMDIKESSHEQSFYMQPERGEQLENTSIEFSDSKRPESLGTTEKSPIASEPVAESSTVVDLKIEGHEERKATDLTPSAKDLLQSVETPKEQFINPNLDNQKQLEEHAVKKATEQKTQILTSKSSNKKICNKINTPTKIQPETTKNNEMTSNATTASKRISKFKKGKINLVTRNKPLIADRNKADESKNANNKDELQTDGNKIEYNKKVYLEPRNKSINEREEDKSEEQLKEANDSKPDKTAIEGNQEGEKSQNKIPNLNAKEITPTQVSDIEKETMKEIKEIQTKDTISQDLGGENPQNKPDTFKELLSKDSSKDIIEIPKASIRRAPILPTKSGKEMKFKTSSVFGEETDSLTKQTHSSEAKASDLQTNVGEEIHNSQEVSSGEDNQQPSKSLEIKQQIIAEIASKSDDDKVIQKSQLDSRNSLESGDLQIKKDNSEIMLKSPIIEALQEEEKNLAPKSPKASIDSMEQLAETKKANQKTNFRLIESLKVENNDLGSTEVEKECNEIFTVAKTEEEHNVFGLPKALTGRMQVLQTPKATTINENSRYEILESQEVKSLKSFDAAHIELQKLNKPASENNMDDTKLFQPKLGIPKTSLRFVRTKQQYAAKSKEKEEIRNDETPLKTAKIEITEMPENFVKKCETMENLSQQSQAILQTMKSAKISLIDIVKHSPTKPLNKSPILPFKTQPSDTKNKATNVGGISTLLNQLKGPRNENEQEEKLTKTKQTSKNKEEQNTSKCCRRSSSSTSKALAAHLPVHLPPKITSKRLSVHPLINDDDLEFLPENAEIKFKFLKLKQKEENNFPNTENLTTAAQNTRGSLCSSALRKRTRFYSQTLESNVTITFDNLKEKNSLAKNVKHLTTEESCHDSTQDSNFVTPIKQRKKLRKTMEDIKKSQNALSESDSEDFHHDYDCLAGDCGEGNEFLGFEETPTTSSHNTNPPSHVISETEHESKTKHGGLKNWLTTGKAISPTFDKTTSLKRLRHDHESLNDASVSIPTVINSTTVTKQQIPLKKRWDLCSKTAYEETDITDDTSPVDDEDEISEQIPINKIFKRGIENVIDSNKNAIDSKKIKLDEHSFIKCPAIVQNVCGSEEQVENEKNLENDLSKTTKSQDVNLVNEEAPTNSKKGRKKPSKDRRGSEKSKRIDKNTEKQFKAQDNNAETKESIQSAESKHCKEKHSEKLVEISNSISTKDVGNEIKQIENYNKSKEKTSNDSKPQKSKRGRKAKIKQNTSDVEKESYIIPKLQETVKPDHALTAAVVAKISCSTPESFKINKRKRGRSEQNAHQEVPTSQLDTNLNESSEEEGPLSSLKKPNLYDFESLIDSNSLLTPLRISSVSPTQNINIEELDSNSLLTPLDNAKEANSSTTDIKPVSRRGNYRRSISNVLNFNSRLLLITKREQLESEEILTEETNSDSGSLQCGLCLTRTQPSKWITHLAQHYGVGWQMVEERLNIENRSVVLNAIANYIKNNKNIPLACRMCKKVLRSALGILTHIEQCGNQERIKCEFCERDYTKNSLIVHLRTCQVRFELEKQKCAEQIAVIKAEEAKEVVGNTGRLKRHSTIKAENKLKVLGKELESLADTEKPQIDPKLYIKYVPRLDTDFTDKWSKEIENAGQASCPKSRCRFTSSNLPELSEHIKKCKQVKSGYTCSFCRKAFKIEKEAVDHIIAQHQKGRSRRKSDDSDCGVKTDFETSSDDAELSEGVDENESSDNSSSEEEDPGDIAQDTLSKKGKSKPKITNRKEVFNGRYSHLNTEVKRRWNNFTKLNYSCEPLYNEFTPQYSVLNHPDYKKYLPAQNVSIKFNFSTNKKLNETFGSPQTAIEWSELKRFETINNNMHTFFFLGAPIKFCSWLPLPANVDEQYLAVIYRQEMFKYTKFTQPKQHHSIVLLFKVTHKSKVPQLSVHYGFVIDDGPIHHVTFLPSGGYDASSNRLGLMAVATVTSCIRVFSLPLTVGLAIKTKNSENTSSVDNITLIDIKPSFQLNLDIAQQNDEDTQQHVLMNPQCLYICWSEYSGHQHIFAGFSNGFVGIWNIINNSQKNLNRFVIDNIVNYAPVNYFFLGEKSAKCIALHYDTFGPRWLAVSTAYRKLMVYDIKNFMNPVVIKEEFLRNILLSIDWCPIWEPFLFSYDDVLPNSAGNGVLAINPTNVIFHHSKLDISTSAITQVHYTPLKNMCVTASSNGDVVFLDTKELHYECCLSKRPYERRAFYASDIKQLNGEPLAILPKGSKKKGSDELTKNWVMNDYNYKEKYGLIFTPLLKLDEKFKKVYLSANRIPPPNILPFLRVNALRCNLNQQAKSLVAVGYENGFLRLLNYNK